MEMVYSELHRLAQGYLRKERKDHTLQPTALVHEAWLKLADRTRGHWQGRAHFLGTAARAMREILVDHARARLVARRGGGAARVTLDEALVPEAGCEVDLLALDDALQRLSALDSRKAEVVELRFFGGLTIEETAEVLSVSHMTVSSDWRVARGWLAEELGAEP